MTDPLFGSVSPPLWPAIPAPVYGYAQSPLASSQRFGTMHQVVPLRDRHRLARSTPADAEHTRSGPARVRRGVRGPELCRRIVRRRVEPTRQRRARLHGGECNWRHGPGAPRRPLPCGAASHSAQPTIRKSKISSTTRSICFLERTTSKCASKEGARYCPARSRTNDSSATSVNWPGRFPR